MQTFAENMGVKIIHIDATAQFMGKPGVADPEAKRKIIGREFVEVFQDQAGKQKSAKWLAQGTIYPDVIESAGAKTGKATSIVAPQRRRPARHAEPEAAGGCANCSDEVRELGVALGPPPQMVYRHPFPGLAWACGSWARSSTSTPNCCVAPMRSSSKSCATPRTRPAA